jgi:hypothetical protein
MPDYVPEELRHLFRQAEANRNQRDWIPDASAPPEVKITREQEMYGIEWQPGDPIPVKKEIVPFLGPDGKRVPKEEIARAKKAGTIPAEMVGERGK